MRDDEVAAIFQTAIQKHRQGDWAGARLMYEEQLRHQPDDAQALHLLGVVLLQGGEGQKAVDHIQRALDLAGPNAAMLANLGAACHAVNRPVEAEAALKQAIQLHSSYPEAYNNLGLVYLKARQGDKAIACFQKAIGFKPDYVMALRNLADACSRFGHYALMRDCCLRLQTLLPGDVRVHVALGIAYRQLGRFEDAAKTLRRAVELGPREASAWMNLAEVYSQLTQWTLCIEAYEHLIRLTPEDPFVHNGLGVVLRQSGQPAAAEASYRRAIGLNPSFARAHSNLGIALKAQGKLHEALMHYRQADQLEPTAIHLGNLIFSSNYDPNLAPVELFDLHLQWRQRYGLQPLGGIRYRHDRTPGRRLRVGYVSGDLCIHPAARFIESFLLQHDADQFEVYAYANQPINDQVSKRLASGCARWHNTFQMSDDALVALIQKDRIDILVDLSGHSARNRLTVFARKPAPVQVSMLGYPNTSAVEAMDYYLTDDQVDPPTDPRLYTEQLLRLTTHCFACLTPPAEAPPVAPLPAKRTGGITFGSLLDLAKINDSVLDVWCRLIHQTPGSRLFLFRGTLQGTLAEDLRRRLLERALSPDRFEIQHQVNPALGWLEVYRHVDIALDAWPWSGHTTACEALWMGVPVLTCYGDRHAGRMVASVMRRIGLSEFVADSHDNFVTRGSMLAERIDWLQTLRSTLRQRLLDSPVCDAKGFTREIQKHYRQIWARWCASER